MNSLKGLQKQTPPSQITGVPSVQISLATPVVVVIDLVDEGLSGLVDTGEGRSFVQKQLPLVQVTEVPSKHLT